MPISIRRPWRSAAVLALGLSCALAAVADSPSRPLGSAMLDAGTEGGYAFTIEAKSLVRDGERVRFRLLAASVDRADHYDSTIEVDCAHRTRRQLSAIGDDGHGQVNRYGDETGPHAVSQGTRADRELRLVCARAGVQAASAPHLAAAASDLVDAGTDAGGARAIFIDSVQRHDAVVDYMLQTVVDGGRNATRQHVVVDCARKLRAVQDDDAPAHTRLWALHVAPASREGRELAVACAMPEGPRNRWFAGFVVSSDGVVVAPHSRTIGCDSIVMGAGAQRRTLEAIAQEDDVTLLRIPGGGYWTAMPAAFDAAASPRVAATLLGVSGTAPRVSAAYVEQAGANSDDPGWPQVRTLKDRAMMEGMVWNASGWAVGLALAIKRPEARGTTTLVRMLPVDAVRDRLQRHGLSWRAADAGSIAPDSAMQVALAATVPLICHRNP